MSSTDGPALPPISARVASPVVLRNSVAAPVISTHGVQRVRAGGAGAQGRQHQAVGAARNVHGRRAAVPLNGTLSAPTLTSVPSFGGICRASTALAASRS